ncbi:hypothetical protein [Kitasatospora phosalacinea]|uniref:hypothetical protein n=1 Tax=Kitasatospora phosalacinea TaxID=2065 RepID=UPI00068EDEB9
MTGAAAPNPAFPHLTPSGFGPSDLLGAYKLPANGGAGTTIAPNAHIVLVEAGSATMADLGASVNTAVSLGAKYVSNSYGGSESSAGSSPASFPYARTSALFDVTTGSNGSCSPACLCKAGTGHDGPTGLGTPNGTTAFKG